MSEKKGFDFKKFASANGIWLVFIGMVAIVAILVQIRLGRQAFLSPANIQTLVENESIRGILCFGVMFAITAKGTDLSTGSLAGFLAVVSASLAQKADASGKLLGFGPLPGPIVWILCIALGAAIGALVGAIIAYTKIHPFIATLGGQLIWRAAAKMYSNKPVSKLSDGFRWIAKGKIGPIPMVVVVFILMFLLANFLLEKTRFGKNVFAIGGNDQAARVAGINVERNLVLVYAWCNGCAALGGILLAAKTGSADPSTYGLQYELDAIAAATVGGTSQTGGICKATGALAGILIMGVITNGLVLLGVDDNLTNIIKGLIIVGAVVLDMRKNAKKK